MERLKTRTQKKRKLFFETLSLKNVELSIEYLISNDKINRLKYNNIRTVFIESAIPVEPSIYLRLINEFSRLGFQVKTNHTDALNTDNLASVKNHVEEMYKSFHDGGCLVISYDRSYAQAVIGCFFVSIGKSADNAIDFSNSLSSEMNLTELEESFIYTFQNFINNKNTAFNNIEVKNDISKNKISPPIDNNLIDSDIIKEPVIDKIKSERLEVKALPDEEIIDEKNEKAVVEPVNKEDLIKAEKPDKVSDSNKKDILVSPEPIIDKKDENKKAINKAETNKKNEKESKQEAGLVSLDTAEDLKTGKFYSSIRFKLITIISLIIIVSINGMIFLATYFFKEDNIIRVQENNHKFSELIELKVSSDINSIIGKSKFLMSISIMEAKKSSVTLHALEEDKDILFIGMSKRINGRADLNYKNSLSNNVLMNKMQILEKDIIDTGIANRSILEKAFDGDRVIQNVSQGFESPVVVISIPYEQSENREVQSIIVVFIKFDRLLKTFKPSGIISSFMVNDRGDVIGHHDSKIVQAGANNIDLPIVKKMMESKLDNGQTRYKDEKGKFILGSFKKLKLWGAGVIALVEEEKALEAVYKIQRRNRYLMIAILSCAILIVFFFGKTLTKPILNLLKATNLIKDGHYRVDIKPASNDEIGQLTSSFIEMGIGLEEREKIKDAFGKFVNKEIAEQVLKGEIRLGGETKPAAVFFSDIRSFTSISEKLEPEEIVEFLNDYMTRMVKCVNLTNGVVDKYIGDAIMAIWGVPISKGNDTENAVNGALMMRKELIEFNNGRGGDKKPIIKIGCGINTGDVLAGQIGSEERMEYTVIGDTVNLASRIEALNKPFGTDILISQDSYEIVKDMFAVEKMSPISVQGKAEKQQIYAVLGRLNDPGRPKDLDELRTLLDIEKVKFDRRTDDVDELEKEKKYEILDE